MQNVFFSLMLTFNHERLVKLSYKRKVKTSPQTWRSSIYIYSGGKSAVFPSENRRVIIKFPSTGEERLFTASAIGVTRFRDLSSFSKTGICKM